MKKSASNFDENINLFLLMMVAERGASKNTISAYERDLYELKLDLKTQKLDVTNAKTGHLKAYFSKLKQSGLSKATIMRKNSCIKQFYNFLFTDEIINSNPAFAITPPKKEQSLPDCLSIDEVDQLLEASKECHENEDIRLRAIIELLYASGMRITELMTLKLSDLQTIKSGTKRVLRPYLMITGKGNKERIVPLNKSAINALENYLEVRPLMTAGESKKFLFPSKTKKGEITHLTRHRAYQMLQTLAVKANLNPKRVHPHALRHSFASHLLRNGANLKNIQDLMGHSDISSTQIYTHIFNDRMKEFVQDMHPLKNMQFETIKSKDD